MRWRKSELNDYFHKIAASLLQTHFVFWVPTDAFLILKLPVCFLRLMHNNYVLQQTGQSPNFRMTHND